MPETETEAPPRKFGTFGGVFTPCTLTILGVIMFLRFGQVVGQAGLYRALGIVLAAKAITTLTTFSLSAIATNTRVKGGGAYYLISRSLGVEFGGVIGILFFVAQAVSVAMYVIGFTEAFLAAFPAVDLSMRAVGTIVNIGVFACVYIGAGWTIRLQYGILAVLMLALVSFFAGAFPDMSTEVLRSNLAPSYLPGESLLTMFALFFPAVTGIMAGANMSGDLAEPARSIPRGTLLSIAFTAAIYLGMALVLGGVRPQEVLVGNRMVVNDIAWSPALVNAGIFAATLSSALGSMMGAPRILQAFARDDVIQRLKLFSKGSGVADEPRRAILLTVLVAQAGIMLGDLDAIAPIITMFFMITYGTLNLACFYESITKNPSYRPAFRFSHWSTALLGALGCLGVMLLIAPVWALGAVVVMVGIHWYIRRAEVESRWGDVTSGVAFERARKALLKLEEERYHPKNWRPTILALSGEPWRRYHLAEFGYWLTAGRGILTLANVIDGDVEDRMVRRTIEERDLREFIRKEELEAFPAVVVEQDLMDGIKSLMQSHGIGGIRPNTVLTGWSTDPDRIEEFGAIMRLVRDLNRSIIAVWCDEQRERWTVPRGTIDVWWRSGRNGPLMLLLAHLLTQNTEWRDRRIRVLHVAESEEERGRVTKELDEVVASARIQAWTRVFVSKDVAETIHKHSRRAAVVLFGFHPPGEGQEREMVERLTRFMEGLNDVILVSNAGDVSLEA